MKPPILSRGQRSASAKFRNSVAPLKIETDRYSATPICERICFNCTNLVELILYPVYQNISSILFEKEISLNEDISS